MVKCLPTMWETWVQSLGQDDPLEKQTATRSSILASKIPWTEEPGRLQSMGLQRVGHDLTTMSFSCMFPAGVIGRMMMSFVETEQSWGSKSGEEEDGLSFIDVEFEVWSAFR